MADLSKPVIYRELNVNGVTQSQRVLDGIAVEAFDYSAAAAVGYMEKRAASDGMYASDVYLGARELNIRGHVHAPTQPELFDYLHIVRAVFAPTGAYAASPGDRGFLPLYFDQPTADLTSFPGGSQNLFINARPMELVKFAIVRDNLNGQVDRPTAIPWSARLIAKDPRIYVYPEQYKLLNGGPVAAQQSPPLDAINRGDYEAPVNFMLVVGAISAAQTFVLRGFGGVTMTINIENKPNVIYRYYGEDRLLMTQDRLDSTAPEALRMDLLIWNSKNRYPVAPAAINPTLRPFKTTWTYTCGATLLSGSRLWWNEAFA